MMPLPSHIIYLSSEQIKKYLRSICIYCDEKNVINTSAINLETSYMENVPLFIK